MKNIIRQLIKMAQERHGLEIIPCSGRFSFCGCIQRVNGSVYLYYNDTKTDSTHVVSMECGEADNVKV